ncbi:MAG: SPOR domain-containing protein [Treponema sp.]|jgi:hypothetical protein|nr:SPOR domain-containing protein [Treponema sp.]
MNENRENTKAIKNISNLKQAVTAPVMMALVLFVSASIWEGAAAVSADFPSAGLYVATNSFPRNTVVDLTNLETGKTVRVIVSAGLDSPGLLALVSREAAEKVGLQSRSIGRIRMTQPSDPIAFSRFTEDHLDSGDPDYDPRAALEAYGAPETAALPPDSSASVPAASVPVASVPDTASVPAATVPATASVPAASAPDTAAVTAKPDTLPPVAAVIPGTSVGPEREAEAAAKEPAAEKAEANYPDAASAWISDGQLALLAEPAASTLPEKAAVPPVKEPAEEAVVIKDIPAAPAVSPPPAAAETPAAPAPPAVSPPPAAAETPAAEPPYTGEWDAAAGYSLEPSSDRPPVVDWTSPDPSLAWAGTPPVDTAPSSYARPEADPSLPQEFSVPTIGTLERDRYYLQIGAYSKADTVEKELAKIERNLPLAVQRVNASGKPVYRILVGPVNHGESGALLQKFKTKGYNDAFIRAGN